ncbi:tetratricopeptide repeat protein [candidate division CSSED10-310 bacterium]|uniref:Tetratricopeptide repeat protein n=1 Tax=candidate division CSSED10-310 bacterium TaxID=2855610 RepID=A0ABV6YRT9_UNCC1
MKQSSYIGQNSSYELEEPLGRGGMGIVYRARDCQTDERVALKTVLLSKGGGLQGIRREITALARLCHPGIVSIKDHGLQEGIPWYAMEMLQAETLRQFIKKERSIGTAVESEESSTYPLNITSETIVDPHADKTARVWWTRSLSAFQKPGKRSSPDEPVPGAQNQQRASLSEEGGFTKILTVIYRLCQTLAFLHGEGVVHRDLKPENILIQPGEIPVLVDFGLMTVFSGARSREYLKIDDDQAGTVPYMAPEQIRGEFVDARADLYSLGCILYEILLGHPPFFGVKVDQIARAHLYQQPVPPRHFISGLAPQLNELVLKLLAKDPRERIGYADAVAGTLSSYGLSLPEEPELPPCRPYLYRPGFSGRESDLVTLWDTIRNQKEYRGGIVAVGGESGVGKTRLVLEFAAAAAKRGTPVLVGECRDSAAHPLQGFQIPLQMIADYCREKGELETKRILGKSSAILRSYFAELEALPYLEQKTVPAPLTPKAAQERLFNNLADTIEAFAQDRELLIIIDDLQWIDELTLGFLQFLLRGNFFERVPVFYITTHRSEEVTPELQNFLDKPAIVGLQLNRLTENAVSFIMKDMLALSDPPRIFSKFLARHSEGNPFYVAEYLRVAVDEGLLWRGDQGEWLIADREGDPDTEDDYKSLPLPASLYDLVDRHVQRLSPTSQELVLHAAAIGREVDISLLQEILKLSDYELFIVQEEVERIQLMECSANQSLRFMHDKIREGAYQRIPAPEKQDYHFRIACSMEQIYDPEGDDYWAALGYQWEKAGHNTKAQKYYLKAARRAQSVHAHAESIHYFTRFLDLKYPESEEVKDNLYFETVQELAFSQKVSGLWDEAVETLQHGIEQCNIPEWKAKLKADLGFILKEKGHVKQAFSLFEENLLFYQSINNQDGKSGALSRLAMMYEETGEYDRALRYYQKSLVLAEALNNRKNISTILGNMGLVYMAQGNMNKAIDCYQRDLSIKRELNDKQGLCNVLNNMGNYYVLMKEFDNAAACYDEYYQLAKELNLKMHMNTAIGNKGTVHFYQGDLNRALADFHSFLKTSRELGNKLSIGAASANIGTVYQHLGHFDKAREHFLIKLRISEELNDKKGITFIYHNFALLYQQMEQYDEAQNYFNKAIQLSEKLGLKYILCKLYTDKAELCFLQQLYDQVAQFAVKARALAQEIKEKNAQIRIAILEAQLESRSHKTKAIEKLKSLLPQVQSRADEELEARISKELYLLTNQEKYRRKARLLYKKLFEKTPLPRFEKILKELEK